LSSFEALGGTTVCNSRLHCDSLHPSDISIPAIPQPKLTTAFRNPSAVHRGSNSTQVSLPPGNAKSSPEQTPLT
jgi:hypothetical protein